MPRRSSSCSPAPTWTAPATLPTIRTLWPNIAAAVGWMDRRTGTGGFLTYQRSSADGLANQGWKDSHDAISHADGTLARGAIALCEVQGYAYAAYRAAASISARQMGDPQAPGFSSEKADRLRLAFEAAFWVEHLGTYALALDGEGRQCQVRSSNAGQVLMTGIAAPDRARRVVSGLMEPQSFTGWGIRTLAANEARYNPMSYHNGSVWPHDNALIALGMARVGMRQEAVRLLEAMCAAAGAMELHRLPELFCGFGRRPGQGPTSYPVACAPQAWATACIPGLLQACLGIWFDPAAPAVLFNRPALPAFLDRLHLDNLPLAGSRVSVLVRRTHDELSVSVVARTGDSRHQRGDDDVIARQPQRRERNRPRRSWYGQTSGNPRSWPCSAAPGTARSTRRPAGAPRPSRPGWRSGG